MAPSRGQVERIAPCLNPMQQPDKHAAMLRFRDYHTSSMETFIHT